MSRRTAGVVLVGCAALLQAARYLAAATFGSNVAGWDADLFQAMLEYIGSGLSVWIWVLLAVGIGYLIWAEVEAVFSQRAKQE